MFMLLAALAGWRHVRVTKRRTAVDYAHILKELADEHFPDAEKIFLVQDNLNTQKPASLYQAFDPAQARRLALRFEWHDTPKHGSWLNMAQAQLSVLSAQCLKRRIPDGQRLEDEVNAWLKDRNSNNAKADWRFTTEKARAKLKSPYPVI